MILESLISVSAGISRGFLVGLLLGYALKKAIKLIAVIVGRFIAGSAYLQYQQTVSVNWDKIESTITGLANTTTNTLSVYNLEPLTMTTLGVGIPLTGGMSTGFAIGFMNW